MCGFCVSVLDPPEWPDMVFLFVLWAEVLVPWIDRHEEIVFRVEFR